MFARADPWPTRLAALGRRRPLLVDLLLVAFLIATSTARALNESDGRTAAAIFSVVLAVPLLWRRRHPVGVLTAVFALAAVQLAADVRTGADLALLVSLYTVAATQPRRVTVIAAVALEVGVVLATIRWAPHDPLGSFVGLTGLATAAGVLGISVRQRRALLASLEERAARLELERDQQGRLSAAAERARIAREMHDIVAHNLSVMIALADGAGYAIHDDPAQAEEAMATASRTGRQALTEMRRLLGVLRDEETGEGDGARMPQPGLAQLAELIEGMRAAGVPVSHETAGRPPGPLPPGLELAVYRIVQEALTNTLKHAGPGATARVAVDFEGDRLVVVVADTGTPLRPPDGEGRGLRGMHERAAVYDGMVVAGPAPAGGWRVRLTLPLATAPSMSRVS